MVNAYNLKNEAAKRDFSLIDIAELSKCDNDKQISQDILTDLSNNPGMVLTERAVKVCDIIGINAGEYISGLSENALVQDSSLENCSAHFPKDIRKKAEELTDKFGTSSENGGKISASCEKLNEIAENLCRRVTITIYGQKYAGKFSMASNLLGREFKCAGPSISRGYKRAYILSESCAGTELNYPLDGYIYECTSDTDIAGFMGLGSKRREETHRTLGPGCYGSMLNGEKTYVIFSDAPALNRFNVICCDLSGDEKEADLIGNTDIMLILLSETTEYLTKLTNLLHSAWERWGEEMIKHIIFVVPKSDRYLIDETDDTKLKCIKEISKEYIEIIKDCFSNFCNDVEKKLKFEENLPNLVVSYSSIYKNITTGVSDASHNYEFYNALERCAEIVVNEMSLRRESFVKELKSYNDKKDYLSEQQIADISKELNNIFNAEAKNLRNVFKTRYNELMDVNELAEQIKSKGITRSKEDRQRVLAMVNSRLTDLSIEVLNASLLRIYKKIINTKLFPSVSILCGIMTGIILKGTINNSDSMFLSSRLIGVEKEKSADKMEYDEETAMNPVQKVMVGAAVAAVLPVSALLTPIAATAGMVVSSYYAQTNFEKNTARKIVSAYADNNVCDKLVEKIISLRFIPIQNEVLTAVKSLGGDEKMHGYASMLLELLE